MLTDNQINCILQRHSARNKLSFVYQLASPDEYRMLYTRNCGTSNSSAFEMMKSQKIALYPDKRKLDLKRLVKLFWTSKNSE